MKYEGKPLLSLVSNTYDKMAQQREKDITIPNPLGDGDITDPWYFYDRMYRGFHYDLFPTMATWVSRPAFNKPFIGVESNTTLLTDSRPSISVAPREESDTELAEIVQMAIDKWWEDESAQTKVSVAVKSSRIFGLGWLGLFRYGDGCHLKVIHPESMLVDADATVEHEPTAYLYEFRTSIGELMKMFPKVDDEVWQKCDSKWSMGMPASRVQQDRYGTASVNPEVVLSCYQLWLRDTTFIEYDDDTVVKGKVTKMKRPKYKNGWRVITVGGGEELDDSGSEYKHKQAPFIPIHCYPVPGKYYSMGDIQQIFPLVIMRNRYQQYLYDQTLKSGGGYLLIGTQSGVDPSKVSNVPFQIIPCKDVNQFRWEQAPAPSRHIFDALGELDKAIDDILGVHEISRGVYTPGNKTAAEIGTLAESDRTRIRLASRLLAGSIQRLAYQLVCNWAQWNDFEWMLRLAGKEDATKAEFVAFSGKDLKKQTMNPETGSLSMENVQFDLRVGETSMLPGSRNELRMLVDSLAAQGLVGGVDQLKVVGWPNPEATYAKSPRGIEEQAMAAQAAAPPPQAPPQEMMPPEMMPQEMAPPPEVDPALMGAMSPVPEGMTGNPDEDMMNAILAESQATGIPPEVIVQMMMEAGSVL